MSTVQRITPFLWFNDQAEEAARFYTGIFPNSKLGQVSRYGDAGKEIHRMKPGTAMTVSFELDGLPFTALNGGPIYTFTEAISFQVACRDQREVDHYWDKLTAGGDPESQRCGWLKDRFGVSWQVVPVALPSLVGDPAHPGSQRAVAALLKMKKIDIAALQRAHEGA